MLVDYHELKPAIERACIDLLTTSYYLALRGDAVEAAGLSDIASRLGEALTGAQDMESEMLTKMAEEAENA